MQSLRLDTPTTFPVFPYDEPYNIQLALMQHLYSAIEDSCVTIVESPTGTVGETTEIIRYRILISATGKNCKPFVCQPILASR
jgi:hypothetical protein